MQPLAELATDHPALWGRLEVREPAPPLILENAVVLPAWQHRDVEPWWLRHSLGVYDSQGQHVRELSDMRGDRHCCFPPARLEQARFNRPRALRKPLVLYGGTLYDHFGHLLVDSTRAYQLLRLFRHTKLPIWFHDCTPHRGSVLRLAVVQQWLACLGLSNRARLVGRPLLARQLISAAPLYSDRRFVSQDLHPACRAALKPKLVRRLERLGPARRRLAYLSRHKLRGGSTLFAGEAELVERLAELPHVDVICPEELDFEAKIGLYRRYQVVAGFPQSSMHLKLFAPGEQLARQVLFIAGPRSLSSSWLNLERATGFGDLVVDCCTEVAGGTAAPLPTDPSAAGEFQRTNHFNAQTVLKAIVALAG